MEIERKFLIDWEEINNLNLPLIKQAESWKGYLSVATPVVRIRKRDFTYGHTDYILCIKGKGKLARQEIEKELTRTFYTLKSHEKEVKVIYKEDLFSDEIERFLYSYE